MASLFEQIRLELAGYLLLVAAFPGLIFCP
jgi:hypothetical protein